MTHISNNGVVVGAGWLGNPLANKLANSGWHVLKTSRLKKNEKGWAQFNVEQQVCDINLSEAVWFFCIPPGRTPEAQNVYREYLKTSLSVAKTQKAKRFIFCSTTGVYPNKPLSFNENLEIDANTDKQLRLLQNEQIVKERGLNTVIVRLGGLMGPKRHPGRFLSGKTLSSNANASGNMVHQDDAVNGLLFIAEGDYQQPIINLVAPHHPTKKAFYDKATQLLGVLPVNFEGNECEPRIILSEKVRNLGFEFKHKDLFEALEHC